MLDLFNDSFKQKIKEHGSHLFAPDTSPWAQFTLVRILILINCGLFFFIYLFEPYTTLASWKLGSLHNVFISLKHEWFRFITAIFLHGGIGHLFLNMLSLFIIGSFIEPLFSRAQFLIIYLLGGIGSTLTSYYFTLSEINDIYQRESLGASGAILALVGALTIYLIINKSKLDLLNRKRLLNNLAFILVLNLGIGLLINQLGASLIDNAAHIGGFLSGALISFFIKPKSLYFDRDGRVDNLIALLLVALVAIAFAWMIFLYLTERIGINNWIEVYF